MTNRFEKRVAENKAAMDRALASGVITPLLVQKLTEALTINVSELAQLQELKNLAYTDGFLSLEEATSIYKALGNSPESFNSQPVEVKSTVLAFSMAYSDHLLKPNVVAVVIEWPATCPEHN